MNHSTASAMPWWKKALWGLLALLVVLVVVALVTIRHVGAWNLVFPSHDHDTVAPPLPTGIESPALLLFSKTNSFRHVDGIEAGSALLKDIAEKRGWSAFHTENGAVFNGADLARFDAVVFLNASGDTLSPPQQQAFQDWLTAGGGWLGIHAAGDGSHEAWPWYVENLVGVDFIAHIMGPQFQVARVDVELPEHAAMAGLPGSWEHKEEWYSWEESPRDKGFTVLATIDEDSYEPWQRMFGTEVDLRMGDHPVVWGRCVGQGRAIYSTMGHAADSFAAAEHQQLLESALAWALGEAGQLCPDSHETR